MPEIAATRLLLLLDELDAASPDAAPALLVRIRDVGREWLKREWRAGASNGELARAAHELARLSRRLEPERRSQPLECGGVRHIVGEPREPCDWRHTEPLFEVGQKSLVEPGPPLGGSPCPCGV